MFDKYWYRQREFHYIESIQMEQVQQFNNNKGEKDEEGIEHGNEQFFTGIEKQKGERAGDNKVTLNEVYKINEKGF